MMELKTKCRKWRGHYMCRQEGWVLDRQGAFGLSMAIDATTSAVGPPAA